MIAFLLLYEVATKDALFISQYAGGMVHARAIPQCSSAVDDVRTPVYSMKKQQPQTCRQPLVGPFEMHKAARHPSIKRAGII